MPVARAALGERRLLRSALGGAQPLAPARERDLVFVADRARGFARGETVVQAGLHVGELAHDRVPLRLFLRHRGHEIRVVPRELGAPLLRRFRRLPQLLELEFQLVAATLLRRERLRLEVPRLLTRLLLELGRLERGTRGRCRLANRSEPALELLELGLAREHPVQLAVGPEHRDALRGHEVPRRCDESLAFAQRLPIGERLRERVAAAHAVERVGKQARDVRPLDPDLREKGVASRRGPWRAGEGA